MAMTEYDDFTYEGDGDGARYLVCWPKALDVDSVHPDSWEVRDGVNYVAGWREAMRAVARLYAVLAIVGIRDDVQFTAGVLADGTGVVSGRLGLPAAARLVESLDAQRERQEAAPRIRGPDGLDAA